MSKQEIKSDLPGTFYRAPAPGSPPYKADGAAVRVGDVIGTIEVMKIFREVVSEFTGTITFLIENEEPVMPGQAIAVVV